ncbi:hypothetical protein GCM10027415_15110 [Humibacter ginsengisoli]
MLRSGNFRRRQFTVAAAGCRIRSFLSSPFTSADSELDITAKYRGCLQIVILKPGSFSLPVIADCAAGSE